MTRNPGQPRRQTEKYKKPPATVKKLQTPAVATHPQLMKSGVTKRATQSKKVKRISNYAFMPNLPPPLFSNNHANSLNRPRTPTIEERLPIANTVLQPVTGAAQTFHELINDPATGFNVVRSSRLVKVL